MANSFATPKRPFFEYEVAQKEYVVVLPFRKDLDAASGRYRVRKCSEKDGIWTFENYGDQEYVRKIDHLGHPQWYYETGKLDYLSLKRDACVVLEETYGSLIQSGADMSSLDTAAEQSPTRLNTGAMVPLEPVDAQGGVEKNRNAAKLTGLWNSCVNDKKARFENLTTSSASASSNTSQKEVENYSCTSQNQRTRTRDSSDTRTASEIWGLLQTVTRPRSLNENAGNVSGEIESLKKHRSLPHTTGATDVNVLEQDIPGYNSENLQNDTKDNNSASTQQVDTGLPLSAQLVTENPFSGKPTVCHSQMLNARNGKARNDGQSTSTVESNIKTKQKTYESRGGHACEQEKRSKSLNKPESKNSIQNVPPGSNCNNGAGAKKITDSEESNKNQALLETAQSMVTQSDGANDRLQNEKGIYRKNGNPLAEVHVQQIIKDRSTWQGDPSELNLAQTDANSIEQSENIDSRTTKENGKRVASTNDSEEVELKILTLSAEHGRAKREAKKSSSIPEVDREKTDQHVISSKLPSQPDSKERVEDTAKSEISGQEDEESEEQSSDLSKFTRLGLNPEEYVAKTSSIKNNKQTAANELAKPTQDEPLEESTLKGPGNVASPTVNSGSARPTMPCHPTKESTPKLQKSPQQSGKTDDQVMSSDARSGNSFPNRLNNNTINLGRSGAFRVKNEERDAKDKQKKVFDKLKAIFKDIYSKKNATLNEFPHDRTLQKTRVHDLFHLVNVSLADKRNIHELDITQVFTLPYPRKVLLVAAPRFGKTTFFALLAYHWANSCYFMSGFKLCIYFKLQGLDLDGDVSLALLRHLRTRFANNTISEDLLRQSLSFYSEDIILLLDGFDRLTEKSKEAVERFLQEPHPFLKSKIIVASRQKSGRGIVSSFDCCIAILSIRESQLCEVRNVMNANAGKVTEEQEKCMLERLSVLSDLPPYFFYFISALCKLNPPSSEKFHDLYSLLNATVHVIPRHVPPMDFKKFSKTDYISYEIMFQNLGRLCLHALAKRYCTFGEDLLRKELVAKFDDLVNWNFLYPIHDASKETSVWSVSSKLIMVFFATKYLKKQWDGLTTDEIREVFVHRFLCCSGCSGDYVIGRGSNPRLYYVGLLPEIGLKLSPENSLKNATIEMLYNVENIDQSNAFDTVNLLLRVKQGFLHRFSFEDREQGDEELLKKFGNVLNNLTVEGCYIDYQFYHNKLERNFFLKAGAIDSNDVNALNAVFRKNSKGVTDRVHLDFPLKHLDDVISYVTAVLTNSLEGFRFEMEKFLDVEDEFFSKIISSLLDSQLNYSIILTCTENRDIVKIGHQNNMSFEILPNTKNKVNQVKYSIQTFKERNHYKIGLIAKTGISELQNSIYDFVQSANNPQVSLQLL